MRLGASPTPSSRATSTRSYRTPPNGSRLLPTGLDTNEFVHSFVKNAGLGFAIPYLHNGEHHDYLPDFIVRLAGDGERYLILETKGYDPKEDVKAQAAQRWVRAVNASGGHGIWIYDLVSDMSKVGEAVRRASG